MDHVRPYLIDHRAISPPKRLVRASFDIVGSSKPEIFVSSEAGLERDAGYWHIYSWRGDSPCYLGQAIFDGHSLRLSREKGKLIGAVGLGSDGFVVRTYRVSDAGVFLERREDVVPVGSSTSPPIQETRGFDSVELSSAPVLDLLRDPDREASLWRSRAGSAAAPRAPLGTTRTAHWSGRLLECGLLDALRSRDEAILEHYVRLQGEYFNSWNTGRLERIDIDLDQDGSLELLLSDDRDDRNGNQRSWLVYSAKANRECYSGRVVLSPGYFHFDPSSKLLRSWNEREVSQPAVRAYRLEDGMVKYELKRGLSAREELVEAIRGPEWAARAPSTSNLEEDARKQLVGSGSETWTGSGAANALRGLRALGNGRVDPERNYRLIGDCDEVWRESSNSGAAPAR